MFKKSIIFVAIAALIFTVPVMATEGASDSNNSEGEIAAIVNGEKITVRELDQYANIQQLVMSLYQNNQQFAQLLLQTEAGQDLLNEYRKTKMDSMITKELLKMEAEKRNIELTEQIYNSMVSDGKKRIFKIKKREQVTGLKTNESFLMNVCKLNKHNNCPLFKQKEKEDESIDKFSPSYLWAMIKNPFTEV